MDWKKNEYKKLKNMPVKIVTVSKSLPQYARKTDEIIPYLEAWL
jgi:hypothetical protein